MIECKTKDLLQCCNGRRCGHIMYGLLPILPRATSALFLRLDSLLLQLHKDFRTQPRGTMILTHVSTTRNLLTACALVP